MRRLAKVVIVVSMLTGAFAATAGAAGEYEPNDTILTTYGPLLGGTPYIGTIETENDTDWFRFYLGQRVQFDLSAISVTPEGGFTLRLDDGNGHRIRHLHFGSDKVIEHILLTLPAGKYLIEIEGRLGAQYRFQLDPAEALVSSDACGEAIAARAAQFLKIKRVKRRIAHTSKSRKRGYRHYQKKLEAELRHLESVVSQSCA